MQDKMCCHFLVKGKVQGVWFRASTKTVAKKLGLTGWVRNLPDGRVEVIACGDKKKINELELWLKEGPPLAKVTDLFCEELTWEEHPEFETRE